MGQRIIIGGRDRCQDLVAVQVVESVQLPLAAAPRTVPACNDHTVGCLLGDSDTAVLRGSRRCSGDLLPFGCLTRTRLYAR
jgi:hypothetical protein